MIPRRLVLKNFLSYGNSPQTIDFTPYNLICLSGKNGHGKSAIFDAITWALWGQARKESGASRADAGLLHIGQTHMMVIFDFDLEGIWYRIRREYAQTYGKLQAALEFGIVDHTNEICIPLTDKTIQATQQKISSVVRFNFESFANSSFLRQGNSDEFSRKNPKERKEIIASILGLHHYEAIRRLALEKYRDVTQQRQALQALEEGMVRTLAQGPSIKQVYAHVQSALDRIKQEGELYRQKECAMKEQAQMIATLQNDCGLLQMACAHQDKELAAQISIFKTASSEWRSMHRSLGSLVSLESLKREKLLLTTQLSDYQKQLQESLLLKESLLAAQDRYIKAEQAILANYLRELQAKQQEMHTIIASQETRRQVLADLHRRTQESQCALRELEGRIRDGEAYSAQVQKECMYYAQEQHEYNQTKERYNYFEKCAHLLQEQSAELSGRIELVCSQNAECPLCCQQLAFEKQQELRGRIALRMALVNHQNKRLTRVLHVLKERLASQHEHILRVEKKAQEHTRCRAALDSFYEQRKKLENQLLMLEERCVQEKQLHEEGIHRVTQHQEQVRTFEQTKDHFFLRDQSFVHAQQVFQELQRKRECFVHCDPVIYEKITHELREIEKQLSLHAQQDVMRSRQRSLMSEVLLCSERIRALKKQKKEMLALYQQKHEQLMAQQQEYHAQETILTQELHELKKKREQFLEEKGKLESQLQRVEELKVEYDTYQNNMQNLQNLSADYQAIAAATGKDGIQALLIEEAIPEIEQEANEILAKLTHNQAHIFIDSLRDLKKGGTKETLDIKISDSLGIRPYELFSGGEAFRIDFALRIAISKLLARRRGASLQTLIIDEGFGSQDEEGLALVMDAILRIQSEFAKIIIISHIPALKEQFPVHFLVTKTAGCSSMEVIEHG